MNREDLVEASNAFHEAISIYLEEHGMDDFASLMMDSKVEWINWKKELHQKVEQD